LTCPVYATVERQQRGVLAVGLRRGLDSVLDMDH
jgi:hypothetical protein